jgi:RecA-family ATPase
VGKSNAALDLAVAVATGGAWFDAADLFPVAEESRGGTVVILAGEDDGLEVSRRLWRTLCDRWPKDRERELKAAEVAARVVIFPFAGDPLVTVAEADRNSGGEVRRTSFGAALVEELAELAAEANAAGRPLALVVIDPLSRFLASGAEVDAAAATRSIQVAEEVAKLADKPCVLVVHHVTKAARFDPDGASANDIRGTSALTDGSRWTAILRSYTREKGGVAKAGRQRVVTLPDVVELRVVKSNYAACPAALVLRRRDDGGLAPETDSERKDRETEEARERRAAAPTPPVRGARAAGGVTPPKGLF